MVPYILGYKKVPLKTDVTAWLATCPKGTEHLLADQLQAIGATAINFSKKGPIYNFLTVLTCGFAAFFPDLPADQWDIEIEAEIDVILEKLFF